MTDVLIIYPHDNISTNPTMTALVKELTGRGVALTVMAPVPIVLDGWDIRAPAATVTSLPLPSLSPPQVTGLRSALRALEAARVSATLNRYAAIIGTDPLGVAIAFRLNTKARRPFAYLSFELMFEAECEGGYETTLKANELAAARASDLILIQDADRRDAFCKENGVDPSRCVLVPVSSIDARPARTNYLREKLGIRPDQRIVLYQGSLYDWSCRNEFQEMVSYWPDNAYLVIHSRDYLGKRMAKFMRDLSRDSRILVTTGPVSPAELPLLTASADVGLACYRTGPDGWLTGDNLKYLGLSSGKIAYYAMCGLPVLARSLPSIDAIQAEYHFGRSYSRLSESGSALEQILASRDAMGGAARSFYERRLNPIQPIRHFCDRLLSLASNADGTEAKLHHADL